MAAPTDDARARIDDVLTRAAETDRDLGVRSWCASDPRLARAVRAAETTGDTSELDSFDAEVLQPTDNTMRLLRYRETLECRAWQSACERLREQERAHRRFGDAVSEELRTYVALGRATWNALRDGQPKPLPLDPLAADVARLRAGLGGGPDVRPSPIDATRRITSIGDGQRDLADGALPDYATRSADPAAARADRACTSDGHGRRRLSKSERAAAAVRVARGETLEEVGRSLGVSKQAVGNWDEVKIALAVRRAGRAGILHGSKCKSGAVEAWDGDRD